MNDKTDTSSPCVYTRMCKVTPYVTAVAIIALGLVFLATGAAKAAGEGAPLRHVDWSFKAPFGTYDRDALRRGFKVYKELCSACHAMDLMKYRNLGEPGGPEFSDAEVKAIAAEYIMIDGPDDFGDMYERPGLPRDRFVAPFANEQAARASNNGAYPPDLSVIAKARVDGPDYLYSLLTGYSEEPQGMEIAPGMYYNAYFSGSQIAMAPPESSGTASTSPW